MRGSASNGPRRRWGGGWSVALVGCGWLGMASCLVPNADFCGFEYGDASCEGERSLCVLATEKDSHEGIADGCRAHVPEDFVHVAYGLPATVAAAEEWPEDPRSVQGQLAIRGHRGCESLAELGVHFEPVMSEMAQVRRHLEERGRVRRAALRLRDAHVDAIAAFEAAVEAWVAACEQGGAETSATSTGPGETGTETSATGAATGEGPCANHEDCRMPGGDPATPFCEPSTMMCVGCDGVADPDDACAELDPLVPLCVEGACVACVAGNTAACDAQLLVCDTQQMACVGCTAHEQCVAGACDLMAAVASRVVGRIWGIAYITEGMSSASA